MDVFAVAVDGKDAVYAATSPNGKVYKIEPGGQPQTFFDPEDKYIWSLVFDRQGRLMVATGDKGVIYRVAADGKGQVFYDTDETHVISLAVDREGNVIAGGDPKGYLYRISPDGKAFVLYDSGMREVHAVTVAPDGTIYAAVVSSRPGLSPSSVPILVPIRPRAASASVTISLAAESAAAQSIDVVRVGRFSIFEPTSFVDNVARRLLKDNAKRDPGGFARWNRQYDLAVFFGDGLCAFASRGQIALSPERKAAFIRFRSPGSRLCLWSPPRNRRRL